MSSTPSNSRTVAANTGLGIKFTPSNSPYPRTPRSPKKNSVSCESTLSLKRIIGTTVNSPTSFDSLSSERIFGYTAGAAAVICHLDENLRYSQRFFRARPTVVPVAATNSPISTPKLTANDSRYRGVSILRENTGGYSPATTQCDWGDSPSSSKTWTSRERIKAATCLSISRNGRFLAVGETGYAPRVLIFSLLESSDCPISILNEHTFGVKAVAFSPDQKFLATLGTINDGYLYIWSLSQTGTAKLHSSNKCTSSIKAMVWMGGNSLVTVGTRHVKVWRIEDSPSPTSSKRLAFDGIPLSAPVNPATRTLAGRNCLLGVLVDATFSCASSLSDNIAVVCTERGDILCLRDDGDGQRLLKAGHAGFSITCIAIDPRQQLVCVGGRAGLIKDLRFEDLLRPSNKFESRSGQNQSLRNKEDHMGLRSHNPATFCAMAFVADVRVAVDSRHAITISKKGATQSSHPLSSHRDPVLGVGILSQPNHFDSVFFTWTSVGEVRLWDLQGRSKFTLQIELDQSLSSENDESINQCRVVRTSEKGDILVSGDRYGVLRVLGSPTLENCMFTTKAHSSDIQDIAIYEGDRGPLIASCGRDRTVQLFRKLSGMWLLVQTMDEHTAAVSSLLFCQEGEKVMLLSSSTDRTIQIRQLASREMSGQEIIAAIPVKIITLKSSPLSMALSPNDHINTFVVSLLDRTVVTYDILGKLVRSFRATDNDGNDAVVMDALVVSKRRPIPGRPTILAGVSSTDKSIRLYDRTTGAILNREFGHIGSVTGMTLLETESEETTIISTSVDGTIMIWNLSFREHGLQESSETANESVDQSLKDVPTVRPPLRRVLSKVELAEFQRLSPITTSTGPSSPPRALRRKASKYSMPTQSPKLAVSSVPSNYSSVSQDFDTRESPRTQSRSPPLSPKSRITRRPSLASLSSRGRTRSTGNVSEFGSLNMATEQVCRTLRAYRKKIGSAEPVREEVLKELDRELRETARAVGERTLRNKAVNETVLAGLLDQYSERLVSIFDEKVRLSLNANALSETGPAINGKLCVSTTRNATSRLDQSLV